MNVSDPEFQTGRMELPNDEVHLWLVDLAQVGRAENRWRQMLSGDEQARADRYRFARDRQGFTATRGVLRTILAGYMGGDPKDLIFRYTDKDKPFLEPGPSGRDVEFNVSHSGDVALLGFARKRKLGVDVEKVRVDFDPEEIASRFFSEQERSELAELSQAERFTGFFRCWTRKEAYIKAEGTGLSLALDQFDVSLRPNDRDALLATRPDKDEASRWSLREVAAGDGYVGAVCVWGTGWRLKH